MKTHDPFLRHLFGTLDRITVWCVLALLFTGLAWSAAWERGLGLPALDGWHLLLAAVAGRTEDRMALTLLILCAGVGITSATLVGGWLFRHWQRHAQLDLVRLRGARWEREQ